MSMMRLFLLSVFLALPHLPPPSLFCLFPKRLAFLGATTEAALEGRPVGSWVASSALAPRGGDNVLLIDWASWAQFRNLQKGEATRIRDEGCAGRNGWGWLDRGKIHSQPMRWLPFVSSR